MALKRHYDKLLHVTVTFVLMVFFMKWVSAFWAVWFVAILQGGKVDRNRSMSDTYKPWGDLLANGVGYMLVLAYIKL